MLFLAERKWRYLSPTWLLLDASFTFYNSISFCNGLFTSVWWPAAGKRVSRWSCGERISRRTQGGGQAPLLLTLIRWALLLDYTAWLLLRFEHPTLPAACLRLCISLDHLALAPLCGWLSLVDNKKVRFCITSQRYSIIYSRLVLYGGTYWVHSLLHRRHTELKLYQEYKDKQSNDVNMFKTQYIQIKVYKGILFS